MRQGHRKRPLAHAGTTARGGQQARTSLLAAANEDVGMSSDSGIDASSPERHTINGPNLRCTHGYLTRAGTALDIFLNYAFLLVFALLAPLEMHALEMNLDNV